MQRAMWLYWNVWKCVAQLWLEISHICLPSLSHFENHNVPDISTFDFLEPSRAHSRVTLELVWKNGGNNGFKIEGLLKNDLSWKIFSFQAVSKTFCNGVKGFVVILVVLQTLDRLLVRYVLLQPFFSESVY